MIVPRYQTANLGWLFYRELFFKGPYRRRENDPQPRVVFRFDPSTERQLEDRAEIYSTKVKQNFLGIDSSFLSEDKVERLTFGENYFKLRTTYPGMIIGSGYTHETGDIENELKLGFYFDHTTGVPCVPASSVKGVLRSFFKQQGGASYIVETIEEFFWKKVSEEEVEVLENEIFEGQVGGKNVPMSMRDTFFEAIPIACTGNLLGDDYITHHKDELKNPNPLRFLRIEPGVDFRFQFDLKDGSLLSASEKLLLFYELILWNGVGAKTNVGYGQLDEVNGERERLNRELADEKREEERQNEVLKAERREREREKQEEEVEAERIREKKEAKAIIEEADTVIRRTAQIKHQKALNEGIAPLLKYQSMKELISKFPAWFKTYHRKDFKKLSESDELFGNAIPAGANVPEEEQVEGKTATDIFVAKVSDIFQKEMENKRLKKEWMKPLKKNNYYKSLRKILGEERIKDWFINE